MLTKFYLWLLAWSAQRLANEYGDLRAEVVIADGSQSSGGRTVLDRTFWRRS